MIRDGDDIEHQAVDSTLSPSSIYTMGCISHHKKKHYQIPQRVNPFFTKHFYTSTGIPSITIEFPFFIRGISIFNSFAMIPCDKPSIGTTSSNDSGLFAALFACLYLYLSSYLCDVSRISFA